MPQITLEEAFMMLEGTGPVLEVAREISAILRQTNIRGAIIGGVAVSAHGYVRTTVDVDVYVESQSAELGRALEAHGFIHSPERKEFVKSGVPVHVVTRSQLTTPPSQFQDIRGLQTVSLADLINMKLRSGTRNILRAKDLGDVIGLIRHHRLTKDFLPRIDKELRDEFRKLIDAIEREQRGEG